MPLPASATPGQGQLLIDGQFTVAIQGHTEPRLERAQQRFMATLAHQTGIFFTAAAGAPKPLLTISAAAASAPIQQLEEDESYRLEVTPQGAKLTAPNPLGILHGLQTFLQLVHLTPSGFAVPAIVIEDKPRFPWRGLMIDSGRHFMPLDVIERNLDGMESVKLNVLHWHLSDDQGFRVESKTFPLLQQKGSDGLYYTQDQIRHVIDYARDRGIRVVPEFDMPCHTTSWFVGYPEIASGKGPYQIAREWGVFDPAMDPSRESTYQFLDRFFGEMTALFPDRYFHIGGDECDGKEWDANQQIQEFKRAHNLRDNAALQVYFTARIQKLVASRHKVMEGWDEVLQPDTPKEVVIQSWRGRDSLLAAAKGGYRVLLSSGYYIDLNQSAEQHYLVDPLEGIADKLTPGQTANILGGEATMWSEYVSPENVDSRIWPRTAAIAERFWSPQQVRDVASMYARLPLVTMRLKAIGFRYQATGEDMLERMIGDPDPTALRVLASVVQPLQGYARGDTRHYFSYTPLNRLPDAVPPESETGRLFALLAKRIVAGQATPAEIQQARQWLTLWRDNDAQLQPQLTRSDLTQELIPLSTNLHDAAQIGLQALDALASGKPLTGDAQSRAITALKAAEKPEAVLFLTVVAPIELLVDPNYKPTPPKD
jgi:hexosaminidase